MILWSRKRSRFNERINEKLTDQPAIQTAIRVSCTLLSVKRNEIIKYPCLQSSPFWISVNFHFPLFYSVNTKLLLSYHAFCNIFVGNWATFCKWWLICCGGVVSMFLEWFPTIWQTHAFDISCQGFSGLIASKHCLQFKLVNDHSINFPGTGTPI